MNIYFYYSKKNNYSKKMPDNNENSYDRLINIDETPIYMDMP